MNNLQTKTVNRELSKQATCQPALNESLYPATIAARPKFVYCTGFIKATFPSLSVEKVFYQNLSPSFSELKTFQNVNDRISLFDLNQNKNLNSDLYLALSRPENTYIARDMQWTLVDADNITLFRVMPNDEQGLKMLVASIAPIENTDTSGTANSTSVTKQVAVIGEIFDGGQQVTVLLTHIKPVSQETLVRALMAQNKQYNQDKLTLLIQNTLSMIDSFDWTDDERALTYALYNNLTIYTESYQLLYQSNTDGPNPSGYNLISGSTISEQKNQRDIVKVVFDYQGINTGAVQQWYCSVDVSGEFPFLLEPWARFIPSF